MAEKLALQKVFRQGTAVNRHEGAVGARGNSVYRSGDKVFSRPRFASDKHRAVGRSDFTHEIFDFPNGFRFSDELVYLRAAAGANLLFEDAVFVFEPFVFQSAFDGEFDLIHLEGLGDVIGRPFAQGGDGALVADLVVNKPMGWSPAGIEFKRAHLYDINPVGVGATFIAGADRPQIGNISANQTLAGSTSALIWASEVASVYPVTQVWAAVVAPDFQPEETLEPGIPIEELPEFDLLWNGINGRYEGTYDKFTQLGAYKVILYARDIWNSVSVPKQTYINQTVSAEKVIIVAGEGSYDANSPQSAINYVANYAYRTCLFRWIPKTKILYLNSNLSQDVDGNGLADDVDGLPTATNLQTGIGSWASDADQLTIYLIGKGSPDAFQINGGEVVSATDLDGWLDGFQNSTDCKVVVVYDALQSGSFLDNLTPPAGKERITITGCSASEASYCEAGGLISFSQYYFDWLFSGLNVRDSFQAARNAMRAISSYTQNALLDDDGDGDGRPGRRRPFRRSSPLLRSPGRRLWGGDEGPSDGPSPSGHPRQRGVPGRGQSRRGEHRRRHGRGNEPLP